MQLSQPFELAYDFLANDSDVLRSPAPTSSPHLPNRNGHRDSLFDTDIDRKCKHRLMLTCYILDMQHSTFFGRPRLNSPGGIAADLSLPESQAAWDFAIRRGSVKPTTAQRSRRNKSCVELDDGDRYDCFQSMVAMVLRADDTFDPASLLRSFAPVEGRIEGQARTKLAYHTLALCKNTPVREILAVAGESWVMSLKLNDPKEFAMAQITAHAWACGDAGNEEPDLYPRGSLAVGVVGAGSNTNKTITVALKHALHILQLHRDHPVTGLLFQEWAVYLASIVVWARAYVTATSPHRDPAVQPVPLVSTASAHDMDQSVIGTVVNGPAAPISMYQARMVLLWTKAKVERVDVPHCCGLTNWPLDVLGRLVTIGDEVGWFGA